LRLETEPREQTSDDDARNADVDDDEDDESIGTATVTRGGAARGVS
jgi:hypothetical protein